MNRAGEASDVHLRRLMFAGTTREYGRKVHETPTYASTHWVPAVPGVPGTSGRSLRVVSPRILQHGSHQTTSCILTEQTPFDPPPASASVYPTRQSVRPVALPFV
jgi:hypothetical protein